MKKFLFIFIITFTLVLSYVATTTFLKSKDDDENHQSLITPTIYETNIPKPKATSQPAEIYKKYIYSFEGAINPNISIQYPTGNWKVKEDFLSGGTYDFVITNKDKEIKVDLTGLTSGNIKDAALESLSSYGILSKDKFNLKEITSKKNQNEIAYKTFQINGDNKYITVLEIPETGSKTNSWYVFITINSLDLIQIENYMINAVKTLN